MKALLNDLTVGGVLGKVVGHVHVIEFQKKGLPHGHVLLILDELDKPRTPDDYDHIVSAEVLDEAPHPALHGTVSRCEATS